MAVQRIGRKICFSVALTKELEEFMSNDPSDKTKDDFDWELLDIIFRLESCEEAIEIFEDFHECPFCRARSDDNGVLVHKPKKEVMN